MSAHGIRPGTFSLIALAIHDCTSSVSIRAWIEASRQYFPTNDTTATTSLPRKTGAPRLRKNHEADVAQPLGLVAGIAIEGHIQADERWRSRWQSRTDAVSRGQEHTLMGEGAAAAIPKTTPSVVMLVHRSTWRRVMAVLRALSLALDEQAGGALHVS